MQTDLKDTETYSPNSAWTLKRIPELLKEGRSLMTQKPDKQVIAAFTSTVTGISLAPSPQIATQHSSSTTQAGPQRRGKRRAGEGPPASGTSTQRGRLTAPPLRRRQTSARGPPAVQQIKLALSDFQRRNLLDWDQFYIKLELDQASEHISLPSHQEAEYSSIIIDCAVPRLHRNCLRSIKPLHVMTQSR